MQAFGVRLRDRVTDADEIELKSGIRLACALVDDPCRGDVLNRQPGRVEDGDARLRRSTRFCPDDQFSDLGVDVVVGEYPSAYGTLISPEWVHCS